MVGAQHVEPLRAAAQTRLNAMVGTGAFGCRAEFLLQRFTQDAGDPKMILPMLAGSAVYGLARGATLSRLAATAKGGLFTRGIGARFAASSVGFIAEVPTFALSARAMRHASGEIKPGQATSVAQDLAGSAITLGLLKSFSFLGQKGLQGLHGIQVNGTATRLQGAMRSSQFVFTQGSMFAGLMAAHKIEEKFGLRPHVDGATTITDTLASMLSLGVGAHLGHKALGKGYGRWNQELHLQTKIAEQGLAPPRRARPWFRSPWLAGTWMAMGVGLGGTDKAEAASPPSDPPSFPLEAEILNRDLNLIRDETLGLWKLQGLEENRAAASKLFEQAQLELARAQTRFEALGKSPEPSLRSAWQKTFEKITQSQIPFWQGQLEASELKLNLEQARHLQDIGIGVRRLLGKISVLLAELYAEPLPGE